MFHIYAFNCELYVYFNLTSILNWGFLLLEECWKKQTKNHTEQLAFSKKKKKQLQIFL